MSNVSALWITIPPAIDDEPCPMKKELFQRPKLDSALEFLDLLRSTLPQEKYAAFLTLMLDVKEQRKTVAEVIIAVSQLLDGFPQLLKGFSQFLPRGYKLENRF